MSELPGRVVALDYGRRRIGVAVSDPSRTLATPHSVIAHRAPGGEPPAELLALLAQLAPVVIVVGIPLNMDGSEGEMASEARRFGLRVGERTGVPVIERDERLTSVEAERRLRDIGAGRRARDAKGRADMVAAAIVLEDYLAER